MEMIFAIRLMRCLVYRHDIRERAREETIVTAHKRVLPAVNTDAVFAYVREDERVLQARMFAPLDTIIEDPATGSAAAATIALLAMLRTNDEEECSWTVSQGVDMGRPSMISGFTAKRSGAIETVAISGRVRPVMQGQISLDTSVAL